MERFIASALFVAAEGVMQSDRADERAAMPPGRPITERVRVQVRIDIDAYSARIGGD